MTGLQIVAKLMIVVESVMATVNYAVAVVDSVAVMGKLVSMMSVGCAMEEGRAASTVLVSQMGVFFLISAASVMAMAQFSPMAPHVFQIRRAVMEFQEVAKWSIVVVCVVEMEQRHPMDHLVLAIV